MIRAALAIALALAPACLASPPAAADWPQWGKTPQQTSYSDALLPTNASLQEWTFMPKGLDRVVASPVVAFGFVWVADDAGRMFKLDQATGDVVWTWTVPAAATYPACAKCVPDCPCAQIRSTPAVDSEGSVYFGSYDYSVYKLDADGKMKWNFTTGSSVYGPVTLDVDGTVYIGSFDNHLYAIDSDTGVQKWKFPTLSHGDCGVAIGTGEFANTLVTASNEGGLCDDGMCFVFAVDKRTGKEIWRAKNKNGVSGGGMIHGGTYFAGSWNQNVQSIDLATGKTNWKVDVKGEVQARPAYHNGVVFFAVEESKTVLAMNATTGDVIWSYSGALEEFNGSPSVSAAGIVYAGSNDRYLHALNSTTGTLLFKFLTCQNVFASAAIADNGMVFIACNTPTGNRQAGIGAAYAFNPAKHL